MKSVDFEGTNVEFTKPKNMTDEECGSLSTMFDGACNLSKWELNDAEKKHVAEHGYIYVKVLGLGHPPIAPIAAEIGMFTRKGPNGKLEVL